MPESTLWTHKIYFDETFVCFGAIPYKPQYISLAPHSVITPGGLQEITWDARD